MRGSTKDDLARRRKSEEALGWITAVPVREKDALIRIWTHLTGRSLNPSQRSIFLSKPEVRDLRKMMNKRGQNWLATVGRGCLRPARSGAGQELKLSDWLRACSRVPAAILNTPIHDYGGAPDPHTRKVIRGLRPPMQYGEDT